MRSQITVVADGRSSAGAYVVLDVRAPVGMVLPPHAHERQEATLLVLDGRLAVACGEERRVAGPGESVRLPRSAPCRLEAVSDVRVLALAVPAGLEDLVALADAAAPVDPDDLAAVLAAAGIALLPAAWGRVAA